MPTIFEILEHLETFPNGSEILSAEGIEVKKISNDEIMISYMRITKTARRMNQPAILAGV